MSAEIGTLFGRYRLLRSIASDAVSTTYFATTDGGLRRSRLAGVDHYAIRIAEAVDPNDQQAVEAVQKYLSQAQRAGVVDHPTVVRPHDMGIIDGKPYVASPFIRAVPLGDLLAHGGTINQSAALAMFAQLAGALDAAHRAGVVHGGLSPRTIWVGPSAGEDAAYVAYLTGFGTASLLHYYVTKAPSDAPIEDLLYVAPEQLRGEPPTGRSDQYALACAVYHTLAGRPPFERETRSKLYGAHLLVSPPELEAQDAVVAPAASAALLIAMSKAPEDRYPTCGALVHEALPEGSPRPTRSGMAGRRRVRTAERARSASHKRGRATEVARPASRQRTGAAEGGRPASHEREGTSGRRKPRPSSEAGVPVRGWRLWWPFAAAVLALAVAGGALWTITQPDATQRSSTGTAQQASAQVTPQPSSEPGDTAESTARRIAWDVSVATQPISYIDVHGDAVVAAGDSGLVVVETADGGVRWRQNTGAAEVLADHDLVAHGGDVLTAIDIASGQRRWTSDDVAPVLALTMTEQIIIAAGGEQSAPEITVVDRAAGAPLQHLEFNGAGSDAAVMLVADDDVTYVVQGTALAAFEPFQPALGGTPTWQEEIGPAWPILAPVDDAVIVATEDGQICRRAAADGSVHWCETIPGVDAESPRLFTDRESVVVATSEAVVVLDARSGNQEWSVSPGGPTNRVVASASRVVIGDGTGLRVLDADTGDMALHLPELGNVTALALDGGRLYVGSADGGLMAVDIATRR
jgi:serine/threonine protein kinase/outer membrane protein assembly factor BamB